MDADVLNNHVRGRIDAAFLCNAQVLSPPVGGGAGDGQGDVDHACDYGNVMGGAPMGVRRWRLGADAERSHEPWTSDGATRRSCSSIRRMTC